MDVYPDEPILVTLPRTPTAIMISAADAINPVSRGTETHRMADGCTPERFYAAMVDAYLCRHFWEENTPTEEVCMRCGASKPLATTEK